MKKAQNQIHEKKHKIKYMKEPEQQIYKKLK